MHISSTLRYFRRLDKTHFKALIRGSGSCGLRVATGCSVYSVRRLNTKRFLLPNSTFISHYRSTMSDHRLPAHIKPNHYDLTLRPDLATGLFTGTVTIRVRFEAPSSMLQLHTNGLEIKRVCINNVERPFQLDEAHERLQISDAFAEGDDVELAIEYSGDLRDRLVGFYWSTYVNAHGRKIAIATSKLEPTYARQAYPCFDEPSMKATFTVHLLRPKDDAYIALSNMPQTGEEETANGILTHFAKSVPMSTYLTCFIVSDFRSSDDFIVSPNDGQKIPFKVFAAPTQLNKTLYARDIGKKVMEFYLKYFGIAYPLPKLDMVAIPDFVSGAMEHWGLITYRETALLYDPAVSTTSNKIRVAQVVAHELAHSWFGNLVTMAWWDDLWLNEGFASYIEFKGVEAAHPEWNYMDLFTITDLHGVLKLDATLNSHAIVQQVETPDQITEIFDTISYSKGASILRMLEHAVTPELFQRGVTAYLNRHKFGNARTADFLAEMQSLIGERVDVAAFMRTWTEQMGLPVVNVERTETGYRLTQRRFLADPENAAKVEHDYKWTIPITWITNEERNASKNLVWFNRDDEFVNIVVNSSWVKFNPQQIGYYRVNYALNDWRTLISNWREFGVLDRAHLLEESFALADAQHLAYEIPLTLAESILSEEVEYVPWSVAAGLFKRLKMLMRNSQYFNEFKERVAGFPNYAIGQMGWNASEEESDIRKQSRLKVLSFACEMDHQATLDEARRRFVAWLSTDGATAIAPDLKIIVYDFGMLSGNKTEWNLLWQRFVAEQDAGEKLRLMSGLASIRDQSLLVKLINLAADETYIRNQDYFTLLTYISDNESGTALVWDYVRENWLKLVQRFGLNDRYLGRLIPSITRTFSSHTKLEEMQAFFKQHPEGGAGESARKQALETVANNIKWLERNRAMIDEWLMKSKQQETTTLSPSSS